MAVSSTVVIGSDAGVIPYWGAPVWRDEFDQADGPPDPAKWNVRGTEVQNFDYANVTPDNVSVESGICHIRGTWRVAPVSENLASSQTGTWDGSTNTISFASNHGLAVGAWVWVDVLSGSWTDGYYYVREVPSSTTITLSETFRVYVSPGDIGGPGAEYDIPAGTGTCRLYKHRWIDTGYIDHRPLQTGDIAPVEQVYGRWEIRAKVPTDPLVNRGTLAAFWLRNTGTITIGGNAGAEIDIMESWGSGPTAKYQAGTSRFTTFRYTSVPLGGTQWEKLLNYESSTPPYVDDDWHVWAFERTPTHYRAYKDGVKIVDWAGADFPELYGSTFTNPFHVRINLHVGASARYWGLPDPDNQAWTETPLDYQIDYVRIWAYPG